MTPCTLRSDNIPQPNKPKICTLCVNMLMLDQHIQLVLSGRWGRAISWGSTPWPAGARTSTCCPCAPLCTAPTSVRPGVVWRGAQTGTTSALSVATPSPGSPSLLRASLPRQAGCACWMLCKRSTAWDYGNGDMTCCRAGTRPYMQSINSSGQN